MSMLSSDEDLIGRFELTEIHELTKQEKLEYLDAQITGVKSQLWRVRVDAILNHNLITENESEKAAVATKIAEHESNAKRYAEAITLMEALKSEL